MGYKMKGPSLYKPKMADMGIQKKYDKKADDRATSSPYQSNLEDKAKKVIVDTPVSGNDQIKNLEKHKPKNHKTNEAYKKTLLLAQQRAQSERDEKKKA
jgi:hypothetical protein